MPSFRRGDVVRVPFPYTDRATRQHRPALVVSDGGIGDREGLLWVVMITSADNRPWPGDLTLGNRYAEAGLPSPSVIRPCKMATIEATHAEPIGRIKSSLMTKVVDVLRGCLGSS